MTQSVRSQNPFVVSDLVPSSLLVLNFANHRQSSPVLVADASVIGRAKLNIVILPGLNAVARYVVDHNLLVNSLNSSCLGAGAWALAATGATRAGPLKL